MHFIKKNRRLSYVLCFAMLATITFSSNLEARVNSDIQKRYETTYELKEYTLLVDLITYDSTRSKPRFVVDAFGFVVPHRHEASDRTLVFSRTERVIIEKIDFDAKRIDIDIRAVSGDARGVVRFVFDEQLSPTFTEEDVFQQRFTKIFLKESLKNFPVFTDVINTKLEAGEVPLGCTVEELYAMFGAPTSVVESVDEYGRKKTVTYERGSEVFLFDFQNNQLIQWRKEYGKKYER